MNGFFSSTARPLLRSTSTRTLVTAARPPLLGRIRTAVVSTSVVLGAGALLYYAQDSRAGLHRCVSPLSELD